MVSHSAALRNIQRKPFVEMHADDVKALGLSDGDTAVVSAGEFSVELPIVVSDIAKGAVFIPYDQQGLHANELMRGVNPVVEVKAP